MYIIIFLIIFQHLRVIHFSVILKIFENEGEKFW